MASLWRIAQSRAKLLARFGERPISHGGRVAGGTWLRWVSARLEMGKMGQDTMRVQAEQSEFVRH